MPIAHFSVTPEGRKVEGDYAVYLDRVLFRAGDYPEHAFCLSPEEMRASAERFVGPAAGNIEHTAFLAGKAVFVDALRIDARDSGLLRGDVRIPLSLDECLGDHERRVSAEWDIGTKDFLRLALTTTPAIREADLMATFAKKVAGTPHGRMKMQTIHDHAASSGAYCADASGNAPATFVSRAERGAFQKIHDHAVEHGAACPGGSSYFTAIPPKGKKMGLLARFLGLQAAAPADKQMTDDELVTVFSRLNDDEPAKFELKAVAAELVPGTADFSQNAEFVALKASAAAATAQNAAFKARLLDADAKAWVATMTRKTLPAEHAAMVVAFTQATLDDEAPDAVARFSEPAKALATSRVALLKAMFAARPDHLIYNEVLRDDIPDGSVLVKSVAEFKAKGEADPAEVANLRKYSGILRDVKATA